MVNWLTSDANNGSTGAWSCTSDSTTSYTTPWAAKDKAKAPAKGRSGSFRDKLTGLTKKNPIGKMAHHVIPNAFKWTIWRMSRGQINVDDPKYGSWWKSTDHLTHARQYNLEWAKWLARNKKAGTKQILDFAREIAHKYGQTIYF